MRRKFVFGLVRNEIPIKRKWCERENIWGNLISILDGANEFEYMSLTSVDGDVKKGIGAIRFPHIDFMVSLITHNDWFRPTHTDWRHKWFFRWYLDILTKQKWCKNIWQNKRKCLWLDFKAASESFFIYKWRHNSSSK